MPGVAFFFFKDTATPEVSALSLLDALPILVLALTVSLAVIVWLPLVFRVALKVPVPLVKVLLAGGTAAPSPLVKGTVPISPGVGLLKSSVALTGHVKAMPGVAFVGALTRNF